MKKALIILSLFFYFGVSYSQEDMQLAMGYFNGGEYDKAEVLFDKLYKQRNSKFYFDYYLECLVQQEKFSEAEKRVEKELKKNPNDLTFSVDLGYINKQQGNIDEAEKQYKYVIKNLPINANKIIEVGNSFFRKKEYDWAEKTYVEGNELMNNQFMQNLANVYAAQRKFEGMIESYLDYANSDYSKLPNVKTTFESYMNNDVNDEFTDILQRVLLTRIQKGNNEVYEELLVWFYIKKGEFLNAYIYGKALDKRKNENGVRVFRIGELAFENEDYSTANKAFSYVVEKGVAYPYFFKARFALLDVMYYQVENGEITSEEEIKRLEENYLTVINELGISQRTVDLIVDLAHLQAFYLNKEQEALTLLQDALNIVGLTDDFKAKFMLELGDIFVFAEMPWDAVLTYARIEEFFPSLEITDDAKFKKAKVYFYLGEFNWAKDQWDILKGSPSKLIANDAIYWSYFIDENLGYDSLQIGLKKYVRADLYFYQHNYDAAILTADTIIRDFSSEPVVPQTFYLKYEVYEQTKEYQKAAMNLEAIVEDYSYAMFADKALFELAELYDYKLDNKEKAADCYKKILFDFQGSLYSEPSRTRYRELSGL
ncbi:MAG: tetratricopeptide repeat protein [Bacteroidales bacterium]|nr:tetratricopeptide repeat protein [Bacteroidales bacterium]